MHILHKVYFIRIYQLCAKKIPLKSTQIIFFSFSLEHCNTFDKLHDFPGTGCFVRLQNNVGSRHFSYQVIGNPDHRGLRDDGVPQQDTLQAGGGHLQKYTKTNTKSLLLRIQKMSIKTNMQSNMIKRVTHIWKEVTSWYKNLDSFWTVFSRSIWFDYSELGYNAIVMCQ